MYAIGMKKKLECHLGFPSTHLTTISEYNKQARQSPSRFVFLGLSPSNKEQEKKQKPL